MEYGSTIDRLVETQFVFIHFDKQEQWYNIAPAPSPYRDITVRSTVIEGYAKRKGPKWCSHNIRQDKVNIIREWVFGWPRCMEMEIARDTRCGVCDSAWRIWSIKRLELKVLSGVINNSNTQRFKQKKKMVVVADPILWLIQLSNSSFIYPNSKTLLSVFFVLCRFSNGTARQQKMWSTRSRIQQSFLHMNIPPTSPNVFQPKLWARRRWNKKMTPRITISNMSM